MASCPACGEDAPLGANWCEACGGDLDLAPAAPCVSCSQLDISPDGYCMSCGHKQPAERDHLELVAGSVVAVTDKGLRHHHNEDAVAIAQLDAAGAGAGAGAAIVVCDGVSSTPGSAEASLAAADSALDVLVRARSGADVDVEALLLEAAEAAQRAAARAPVGDHVSPAGPPSSTFVAVVAQPVGAVLRLAVAWLGDSRAYWIDIEGATQLTEDHEFEGSLTRWLGADGDGLAPQGVEFTFSRSGILLVCSDGLWRYADPAPELHGLVRRLIEDGAEDDLSLAKRLVVHALDGGGHDNISVALWAWTESDNDE